jgi:O-antigen/teichoic acid export membrane protein
MPQLRISARAMARASIGQGLATFWSALLGLITAPVLIRDLGAAQYGMFALLGLVTSYMSNLEFGFGHATLRFLAHAHAAGDVEEERAVFGNGLLIFTLGALVAAGLTFFGASFIVHNFAHGRTTLHRTFLNAVRIGAPIVGISMLSSFMSAALQARGRYRMIIAAPWVVGTGLSVGAIAIVLLGGGLVDVVALQLVINSLLLLTYCVGLVRAAGGTLRPRLDRKTFAAMAKFSVWLMVAGLAGQAMLQGPPAVLAAYKTTTEVAAFAIPNTILQQLTNVVGATGIGFLPFVSAASADSDHAPVRAIYAANLRMTIIVLAPIVAFIAVFAHPLLATWIGSAFAGRASTALRFMMGAALMLGISSAPSDLTRGFNKPSLVTGYTALSAALTLALAFLVVPAHGAAGAAFALALGIGVVTIPFALIAPAWIIDLSPLTLLRALAGPIFGLTIVGAVDASGLLVSDTFVSAVVTGAVGTGIYLLVASRAILDDRERRVLRSLLQRLTPIGGDDTGSPPAPA